MLKGGIGVRYWDYRDEVFFRYVTGNVIVDVGCGEKKTSVFFVPLVCTVRRKRLLK